MKNIYWGIHLDNNLDLLKIFPPVHENVYAEHATIIFSPTEDHDIKLSKEIGKTIILTTVGHYYDSKGQAIRVAGYDRLDGGILHITISCANGVKPVYSNSLLANTKLYLPTPISTLKGTLGRFTNRGWVFN